MGFFCEYCFQCIVGISLYGLFDIESVDGRLLVYYGDYILLQCYFMVILIRNQFVRIIVEVFFNYFIVCEGIFIRIYVDEGVNFEYE